MESFGRPLIIIGLVLVGLGLVLQFGPSVPWLGRLPGDIRIERPNLRVYVPIASSIVISVVLTGLLWLWSKLR